MPSKDEQMHTFLNSDTISDDFFIDVVEKKLNISRETFKLRFVLISPVTGKYEIFVSTICRANIKIEILKTNLRQSVDVIVKVWLSKVLEGFNIFHREKFVYKKILRSFEQIWYDHGENILFGPKSIKFESDPYKIIVLDDLKASNYKMLDRKIGLNMAQTKLLLMKLAKFHAASAIRFQKDGIIHSYLERNNRVIPEDSPWIADFKRIYDTFLDAVKYYGDCESQYRKIAGWSAKRLMKTGLDVAEPMECGFRVLNHGNLCTNNIMFQSDIDNNPVDVQMIDFQASFWGSPAGDLFNFLISSVADNINIKHFDKFIEFYHEQLSLALKSLKFKQHIPTLPEIQFNLVDNAGYGLTRLLYMLFVVKNDSKEDIEIGKILTQETEEIKRVYYGDRYRKATKLWLKYLDKNGFLDSEILDDEIYVNLQKLKIV